MPMPDMRNMLPGQPSLFVIGWGPGDCVIEGPFGDDLERATKAARKLILGDERVDSAGLVILHVFPVKLP